MSNISIRLLAGFLFFFSGLTTLAQGEDKQDSIATVPSDSAAMELRRFDNNTLEELKDSAEMDYGYGPAAMSLWERFLRWLRSLFGDMMNAAVSADWFEILIYALAVCLLIFVILRLLRIDAIKMFYGKSASPIQAEGIQENIHEMDFESLLAEAVRKNDYRLAIRLLFLHSLKILSDKQLIRWQPGKTNHDYLDELNAVQLKAGFNRLNYYFEYAWYGNFKVAPELFTKVKETFNDWKNKV